MQRVIRIVASREDTEKLWNIIMTLVMQWVGIFLLKQPPFKNYGGV
jgi:hypothetical protein